MERVTQHKALSTRFPSSFSLSLSLALPAVTLGFRLNPLLLHGCKGKREKKSRPSRTTGLLAHLSYQTGTGKPECVLGRFT